MPRYFVEYGDTAIEFELIRKAVKNINLHVKPSMEVVISANNDVPLDYIKRFIHKKGAWIIEQLRYFGQYRQPDRPPKEYVSGESFKYLGRQYRLKVYESGKDSIRYYRGRIELYVRDKTNRKRKEKLIIDWYNNKSKIKFSGALDNMHMLVKGMGIDKPTLKIRRMKTRWGTCLPEKGSIQLNTDLIKAPMICIEYVALHELLHFLHKQHNREFILSLSSIMPDWQERKRILDEEIVREL